MSLKNLKVEQYEDIMLLARIAEQSEQYDDMIDILQGYFEKKESDLTSEERNIFCVAYKNAVGLRRIAWRAAKAAAEMPKYKSYSRDSLSY